MDSSHHGRGHSKESSSDMSSSNRDQSPPPPPVAPPHMMYYQPGMGYPPCHNGQPQPYHPYPPPPPGYAQYPNEYPHGYGYPPATYYGGGGQVYHSGGGGRAFVRGFIMCSCIIFTCFFIATLVMALVLHPQSPVFKVSSLSVTNFNTNTTLTADWNINVAIENHNDNLRDSFYDFKVELLHKNYEIATSSVPDFEMDKREQKQLDVKTSSNGANGVSFQKWDLDKMAKERQSGIIMLGLRMSTMIVFNSSSIATRDSLLIAICEGLKVVFQNNTGIGTLDNGGNPVACKVYV